MRSLAAHELYRRFLEQTPMNGIDRTTTIKAFNVYEECYFKITDQLCSEDRFTEFIYPDDFVQREAVELLNSMPRDKPWFMQVNFPGPHPPIMSTYAMAESVKNRNGHQSPIDMGTSEKDRMECPQQNIDSKTPQFGGRCNYGAELENLDRLMKKTVEKVETLGELDKTLVCITGDHGEMLGDYGFHGKKVPWQASISVPLICFGPGVAPGNVFEDPVTTLDLGGTFMDLAGVPLGPDMTTKSLRSILQGQKVANRDFVASGLKDWRVVVKKVGDTSYKLVCCKGDCQKTPKTVPQENTNWQMLLYDTTNDHYDMHPIWNKPAILRELQPHLPKGWCPREDPMVAHRLTRD
eukprot:CAMPEP_0118724930 /NCGR_PEP_ID=MMETSP0800-20121206/32862_1 /TAXON_ID=210618 ORGANISM="Striatella unipunctata, Strain CCMP2910" /NCGR_SAMPLE_ID=MMETSP0800 /ASSEMBLY_ACC=CAM_ASM_000638 /LENGTH=350 /DNA_ID=CAMNT_0006633581 /DNA_START=116 /DNA_END=1169 /DNA_ORIENTATION=+